MPFDAFSAPNPSKTAICGAKLPGKICHEEWDFGKKLNDTDLHYELTGETKRNADGAELYRIRASRDIPERGVKSGTIGGG